MKHDNAVLTDPELCSHASQYGIHSHTIETLICVFDEDFKAPQVPAIVESMKKSLETAEVCLEAHLIRRRTRPGLSPCSRGWPAGVSEGIVHPSRRLTVPRRPSCSGNDLRCSILFGIWSKPAGESHRNVQLECLRKVEPSAYAAGEKVQRIGSRPESRDELYEVVEQGQCFVVHCSASTQN